VTDYYDDTAWPWANACQSDGDILNKSSNRYLIENLADGFLMVDTGLKILQINRAITHILGYSPEELLNNNLLNFSYSNKDQLAILTGITKRRHGQRSSYELTLRDRSGNPVITYVNPSPLYDESGQVIGSYGIIKDLTELYQTYSKTLVQAQLLEQISVGVVSTDSQGRIQYFNKRLEQILGIRDLTTDSSALKTIESWLQLLNYQNCVEIEYTHPDGSIRYLHLSALSLTRINNCSYSKVTVISDLTDIVRAHKEAEIATQAKTSLMANIVHDIRTPMIGIIGASDLLSQETLTNYQCKLVSTIQHCSEILLGLINDILDLSRIKAGFSILINREFYLRQLIEECLLMIRPSIDTSKIRLYTNIDPRIPNLLISDPLQLRRILLNLLSNAAKFTIKGHISINIRLMDNFPQTNSDVIWLEFAVEDTGIGIPEDKLACVFEAYHQVNKYDSDGTGLGLSICRELVHLFGGDINVTSEMGQGTTFSFTIPVEVVASAPIIQSINTGPAYDATNPSSKHILIVDDNDINRYILSSMLKRKGYLVSMASNGYECLALLRAQTVDLVLMDMQMPLLNGHDTVHKIRSNPNYSNLPIIALTASTTKEEQDRCFQVGCTDYLPKPSSSESLFAVVDKYLTSKPYTAVTDLEADSMRRELLPELITMMELDLARMKKAQEHEDWDSIAHIAHDIKGSAGIFGFDNLSQLAERLYFNSNQGDSAKIAFTLTELENCLKTIKASIQS